MGWTDSAGLTPSSIEERLTSLEQSMRELTTMVRQIMKSSSSPTTRSSKPVTNMDFDDPISEDNLHPSPTAPKPVHLITELQSEFFGEKEDFASEAHQLGDIVTQGLIDSRQATRLIQLFASLFRCLQLVLIHLY